MFLKSLRTLVFNKLPLLSSFYQAISCQMQRDSSADELTYSSPVLIKIHSKLPSLLQLGGTHRGVTGIGLQKADRHSNLLRYNCREAFSACDTRCLRLDPWRQCLSSYPSHVCSSKTPQRLLWGTGSIRYLQTGVTVQ